MMRKYEKGDEIGSVRLLWFCGNLLCGIFGW